MGREDLSLILGLGSNSPTSLEIRRHAYREWAYVEIAKETADLGQTDGRRRFLRSLRGMDLATLTDKVIEARDARRRRSEKMMQPGPKGAA